MKINKLYLTLLLVSSLSSKLLAQHNQNFNINWYIENQVPAPQGQQKSLGLAGALVGTHNNVLFIAGGTNFPGKLPWHGGKKNYYNDVFLYAVENNKLSLINSNKPIVLPHNLGYSAIASTKKGIVLAGGENENGFTKDVFLIKIKHQEIVIKTLPSLPIALTNASLTVLENTVFLAGGESKAGVSNAFLSLNLDEQDKGWQFLPNLPLPVSHGVFTSHKETNQLFFVGGRKANLGDTSTIYNQVYAYNVADKAWIAKQHLPYALAAATGLSTNNNILIFSGDKGETFHKAETLIAAINKETDPVKKEQLNQEKIVVQSTHPGFSKDVLQYNIATNTWTTLTNQLPYGTVTTGSVIINNQIFIPVGEIRAGVRTPNIIAGTIERN